MLSERRGTYTPFCMSLDQFSCLGKLWDKLGCRLQGFASDLICVLRPTNPEQFTQAHGSWSKLTRYMEASALVTLEEMIWCHGLKTDMGKTAVSNILELGGDLSSNLRAICLRKRRLLLYGLVGWHGRQSDILQIYRWQFVKPKENYYNLFAQILQETVACLNLTTNLGVPSALSPHASLHR